MFECEIIVYILRDFTVDLNVIPDLETDSRPSAVP